MTPIIGAERDALIIEILKRIESDTQVVGSSERVAVWERGWSEVREKFRANPTEDSLIPAFIRAGQPVRSNGEFCWSDDAFDELNYIRGLHRWLLFETFRREGCTSVYEFGCGTGFNLVSLAKMMPDVSMCGFDFSRSAVDLVRSVGVKLDLPIGADWFDMTDPCYIELPERCGVFTFGAIEQIPGKFYEFIDWLVEKRPTVVVHVEPIPELLDPTKLIDYLSLRFMRKRGYTSGLLPYLQSHPEIEIQEAERSNYGSLMLESYARIIWRPRGS